MDQIKSVALTDVSAIPQQVHTQADKKLPMPLLLEPQSSGMTILFMQQWQAWSLTSYSLHLPVQWSLIY